MAIELHIKLRKNQKELWDKLKRFNVIVCHRRFGKTFFAMARLVEQAVQNKHDHSLYAYIAPTFTQAKRIAFLYLVQFTQDIPGIIINKSELSATFPSGAVIKLLGAEQADSLRGIFLDGLVMDETALISSQAWSLVLAPTLIDRTGWAMFIGTPATRMNLFYEQWTLAEHDPDYMRALYTAEDTDIISPAELARLRRTLRPAEYDQEMLCSWDGAVLGSYYRDAIKKLIDEQRYTSVDYDSSYPVYAALDLGYSDLSVWAVFQKVGNRVHIIDCVAFEQTAIPDQCAVMRQREWCPSQIILPHDALHHDVSTGVTRAHIYQRLGFTTIQAPADKRVHDGIELVHELLPRVWLDDKRCNVLLEALIAYRANFDPIKAVHTTKPVHDWASHYCDAVRYLALGVELVGEWGNYNMEALDRGII